MVNVTIYGSTMDPMGLVIGGCAIIYSKPMVNHHAIEMGKSRMNGHFQ
jgi:hypothetical protein